MSARLEGKTALITGAASGIGRSTALLFADEGATLVLADVDEEGGPETERLVRDRGGTAIFVQCDVAATDQVAALVRKCVERFGRLDCAYNNAGIGGASAPLADYDEEDWDRVIAVNLTGVFLCMKHELRQMVTQGSGAIVNAASLVGVIGYPNLTAYNAAKHGVVGLTRTAALEYAAHGIRVNAVCPAWIETPMVMDQGPAPASDSGGARGAGRSYPAQAARAAGGGGSGRRLALLRRRELHHRPAAPRRRRCDRRPRARGGCALSRRRRLRIRRSSPRSWPGRCPRSRARRA